MRQTFGDCVFDRTRRELTRHGAPVHAAPKLLALLELLIDAAPRVVTKTEVHKALWPRTFVSEATLTSLVAELRNAIGDDARTPRLVRTHHGYGYAFIGDVSEPRRSADQPDDSRSFRVVLGEREIALARGEHILGRSPSAAIFVDDSGVSRHHARITIGSAGAMLEDLASKNGTMLNGEPIAAPTPLADSAVIVLGTTALKFRILAAPTSTETVAQKRDTAHR